MAELIIDARSYFDKETMRCEQIDVSQPLKRTVACLGFSQTTIKKVTKLAKDGVKLVV